MKKILIFILLLLISLNANEVIQLVIKPKIVEIINIENKSKNCDFWNMYNKLSNTSTKLNKENTTIKEILRKKHINYRIVLKQRVKKDRVDIDEIRDELCSKSYFTHKLRLTKYIDRYSQENIILKELLEKNYITIESKKDAYYKIEKTIDLEHEKAKEELKKQMSITVQ